MRFVLGALVALLASLGCGSGSSSFNNGPDGSAGASDSGFSSGDSAARGDGGSGGDSGSTGGGDSGTTAGDSGTPGWNGKFSGPLTCTTPGNYSQSNWAQSCGVQRWDIKTGTDSAANGVSLLPTLTTLTSLAAIPTPSPFPMGARVAPTETTVFALQDVNLSFARLEDDSDYHLVIDGNGGAQNMITEVPYPGCVKSGPWGCLISKARASVEATIGLGNLMLDVGHNHNLTVSIIGVGFFDPEHGQFGVSPNNLELHAVLGICFGKGCDPTQ